MKQLSVGILVIGLSVLFGRNYCAPQSKDSPNSSTYILGEQSSGRVAKVEVSSSSDSSTESEENFIEDDFQPQQQQFRQPQVIFRSQPQQVQQQRFQQQRGISRSQPQQVQQAAPQEVQFQRLQSYPTQYQQPQSQYERELAQYNQALRAYQQQTAGATFYQQPQYVTQRPVQQQQYYQPGRQQTYYQPYPSYPQNDYYGRSSYQPARRTSSGSSLFDGISSGLRSITNGFGLFG